MPSFFFGSLVFSCLLVGLEFCWVSDCFAFPFEVEVEVVEEHDGGWRTLTGMLIVFWLILAESLEPT